MIIRTHDSRWTITVHQELGSSTVTELHFGEFSRSLISKFLEKRVSSVASVKMVLCSGWGRLLLDIAITYVITPKF